MGWLTCDMSADFWLNVQIRCDLYSVQQAEAEQLQAIEVYSQAQESVDAAA